MLKLVEVLQYPAEAEASLTLPFEQRQRARLRANLDAGGDVGLFLPRGTVLRGGDLLRSESGIVVEVKASDESVSTASTNDFLLLARCAYHLGNRHIPVQFGNRWLRYLRDHVLDEMVSSLGLIVNHEELPFEPELGAYHSGGH